jgi:EF-P beta-lysylation protein EpmB
MLPAAASAPADEPWRQALKTAIRDPVRLCRALHLPAAVEADAVRASRAFPVFAPWSYVARMRPGDPQDPLLQQVLPLTEELQNTSGFLRDPVGDEAAQLTPGLLQKYHGRALMITTGACAVHCRYCFRRHYPFREAASADPSWARALEAVADDETLEEVILSGGDPLVLVDAQLASLIEHLARIPHLRRLRIHSRLPIVIPARVTTALLQWLRGTRLVPVMVVHANHPREIDDTVAAALRRLVDAGVVVLNQSVLLRRINDDADTLAELCQRLLDCRVLPYYLHQLDRVAGAAHFETPAGVGERLLEQLRARLPGYAVPRYVREVAGARSKVPLA